MSDGILSRLREDSLGHCLTERPAQLNLRQSGLVAQFGIRDLVFVFGEFLCYLEAIDGV